MRWCLFIGLILCNTVLAEFPWLDSSKSLDERIRDIAVPGSFTRVENADTPFAGWLRSLPLRPDTARVWHYDGVLKPNQGAAYRIIDINIGHSDLQQCADAAMRMRMEYLYSRGEYDQIAFNFTSGDRCLFRDWINGLRPVVNGNDVSWRHTGIVDSSYSNFCEYMATIFMYAGTYSLTRELTRIGDLADIRIGDIFIQGGFPGHAVIVVDMAVDSAGDHTLIMLAQGFTPAQDFHVLINPNESSISPWYIVGRGERLITPEWTFDWSELYRF